MEAGDPVSRLVAARVFAGGRARRENLGDGGRELRSQIPGEKRRLVFGGRRSLDRSHAGRALAAAAVVLGRCLSRPHVGAGGLVEQSLEELGGRLAFARREKLA